MVDKGWLVGIRVSSFTIDIPWLQKLLFPFIKMNFKIMSLYMGVVKHLVIFYL